jgi:hypothetical protein
MVITSSCGFAACLNLLAPRLGLEKRWVQRIFSRSYVPILFTHRRPRRFEINPAPNIGKPPSGAIAATCMMVPITELGDQNVGRLSVSITLFSSCKPR